MFRRSGHCLLFPLFRKMFFFIVREPPYLLGNSSPKSQEEIPTIDTLVCDFHSQTFHLATFIYCSHLRARLGSALIVKTASIREFRSEKIREFPSNFRSFIEIHFMLVRLLFMARRRMHVGFWRGNMRERVTWKNWRRWKDSIRISSHKAGW